MLTEAIECPRCQSTASRLRATCRDGSEIVDCERCGTRYRMPPVAAREWANFLAAAEREYQRTRQQYAKRTLIGRLRGAIRAAWASWRGELP